MSKAVDIMLSVLEEQINRQTYAVSKGTYAEVMANLQKTEG